MSGLAAYQHTKDIDSITIRRDDRQRTEIDDLGGLMQDIALRGLLNPIIISRKDGRLIAGERRLTCFRTLSAGYTGPAESNPWKRIPFRYYDELNEHDAQIVELSENFHRKELPWRDMATSIYRIHNLRLEQNPDQTQAETAAELGISDTQVSVMIAVGEALIAKTPDLSGCASAQAAYNILKRQAEREQDALLASLSHNAEKVLAKAAAPAAQPTPATSPAKPQSASQTAADPASLSLPNATPIAEQNTFGSVASVPAEDFASRTFICADFFEFSRNYSDEPFNLLHIDFPYGINFGAARRQNTASDRVAYDDSPDLFWALCGALRDSLDNLVAESAHILFWFSLGLEPDNALTSYERVSQFFRKECNLVVNPFPLVWCRNGSILPDPNRGPRRGYETAFLMTRGDRKIVRPVQNFFEDSDRSEKSLHTSEKPQEMLRYFLSMLVDGTSRVLDPTAGSGSAIRAAKKLGAAHVLGVEKNPEFVELARGKLRADDFASDLTGNL